MEARRKLSINFVPLYFLRFWDKNSSKQHLPRQITSRLLMSIWSMMNQAFPTCEQRLCSEYTKHWSNWGFGRVRTLSRRPNPGICLICLSKDFGNRLTLNKVESESESESESGAHDAVHVKSSRKDDLKYRIVRQTIKLRIFLSNYQVFLFRDVQTELPEGFPTSGQAYGRRIFPRSQIIGWIYAVAGNSSLCTRILGRSHRVLWPIYDPYNI